MADFSNVSDFEVAKARIAVIGCGGGGNNTITTLFDKGISGAVTIAINTDVKHLGITKANKKILIGKSLTKGLGAGGFPEVGKNAALESKGEIRQALDKMDLVFVTCGLGGGTGTGSAPVVARIAREMGAIVIATVTLPFRLEGARVHKAEEGLITLRQNCDTVIAIENQKLLKLAGNQTLKKAFGVADNLIATMIKGITETISEPSLVNLDFADVKTVMRSGGVASIGIGISESPDRCREAVNLALNNPLIDVDYTGATGALIQVIGGDDMRLEEINKIGEIVSSYLDPSAQVMWGARIIPEFRHKIQVITIVTGVKSPYIMGPVAKPAAKSDLGIEMLEK
ncbi:MAG: cell division protein FtsZ [Candidatus Aenigmarchaeota archaeon]|nr:cell division protein FtsZ [Candidatus Aenigmarchaeota archaeon]MDI6722822.1 cell division protein FtsZ [Candidatus Aenigmarchaeota archaeon]